MNKILKKKWKFICLMLSFLSMLCFSSCKDNAENNESNFDPSKPIEITDFTPKSGSAKTRLYIYGKNFGNDVSQISVKIGGLPAKVIGSNGEIIYCLVPKRAVEGTIEVTIGEDSKSVTASEIFNYQSKTVVATLAGYISPTGTKEVKDGPFEDCGFEGPRNLVIDPKNKKHIYMIDGMGLSIRLLDFETNTVSTILQRGQGNWENIRQLQFTRSADTMLIANEKDADGAIAVSLVTRENGFKKPQHLIYYRRNNTCTIHPMNGELYYNSRTTGEIVRYDWETQTSQLLYTLKNRDCQYFIFFHPSGNYAYMTVPNKKLIVKAEYDWENKTLKVANNFVGSEGVEGWRDGQGTNALLGNPMQGCFVKNERYEKEGKSDIYDFYFADQNAHCIRYLTPEGFVYTYAGRGSTGVNSDAYGYIDGDLLKEARFNQPVGIAFDEENKIFYIGDANNSRIRTIEIDE
ncbi:IPT/TIG domain-containing protein [Parabacteroides sp. Marseille-P3160]|uniref:IPT/TIG domain-containing protein n=1 Tax=Parabacteroides sp. Marseille-P3160 TaxID=1917887 RepID=UPI0009BB2647|nr:IPT/TIG domain-containing protein [Parabacteroides sp. Marseille-P3160]